MCATIKLLITCVIFVLFSFTTCASELFPPQAPSVPQPPSLMLYSPGEPEYTDVLVKRQYDKLTLVCELRGDNTPRVYVWNYVSANGTAGASDRMFTIEPVGATSSSKLVKDQLELTDSGQYMCSAPPFSVTKYILVQTRGPKQCARGAFWCGSRCVLAAYVCDGRRDCLRGEDEHAAMCTERICSRPDKLNCSSGRCISESACCRPGGGAALCRQPACCDEHPRYSRLEGYVDMEYPALFEDRHAPDDYGFIQSTIYTVTACALIFMIAVVLLVSAICKMHMKRAALRGYAHAERATRHHYSLHYAQAHRFPPCYEASRLLEQEARGGSAGVGVGVGMGAGGAPGVTSPRPSPAGSPARQALQCTSECGETEGVAEGAEGGGGEARNSGFGLARLSAMFTSRYRQVPTQCCDVEMREVRASSATSSPARAPPAPPAPPALDYRSPTFCDLDTSDLYLGRELNYPPAPAPAPAPAPVDLFRRAAAAAPAERLVERLAERLQHPRPLTLHLGRFQLSIPRFGRRTSSERRPDTPNVAEIDIGELDFVRLDGNETYTLNGRTIRLLGANFENYPVLGPVSDVGVGVGVGVGGGRPPPYAEAVRYKLYGPPPEYLSRDRLDQPREPDTPNTPNTVDEEADSNVEMPPRYEELADGTNDNNNHADTVNDDANTVNNAINTVNDDNDVARSSISTNNALPVNTVTDNNNIENINSVIATLPAIDSDVNANDTSVNGNVANNVIVIN